MAEELSDVEIVLNVFANALASAASGEFRLDAYYEAVRSVYAEVRGAYSVVGFVAGRGLFAFRDPYGIKPIAMGMFVVPAWKRLMNDSTPGIR